MFSNLVHLLACRGAVQASQEIGREEAFSLLANLENCASPSRCPHGRPTVVRISGEDLDKMFSRK
jgi:DNA mismatch repair protein MutL